MPQGRRVALLGGQIGERFNKMGAGKASDSPYKLAASPKGSLREVIIFIWEVSLPGKGCVGRM